MRQLPVPDPGEPDIRSAGRYVRWLAREHAGTIALGILYGCVWMVCLALLPYAIGQAIDAGVTARDTGAVVSIAVVATLLLATSVPLGLVVLVGVPVLVLAIGPLIKPLHRRQQEYRDQQGKLTGRANDIVAGLRVLRGVGGENEF